jgi:hypothetical protein
MGVALSPRQMVRRGGDNGEATGTGKQPYAIALADRDLMALAGVWENWRSPAGEWVRSLAELFPFVKAVDRDEAASALGGARFSGRFKRSERELCAELHNRMPVVLKPEAWPVWLGEERADASALKGHAGAVSIEGNDLLAGQRAGRKRQE